MAGDAPELWVKATKNEEGKYVIPANQYMGSLNLMNYFIFDYFFTAIDEQENMVDAVFSFDETTNTFSTDQMLALNGDLSEIYPYMTFTEVTISKIAEVAATPAAPSVLAFTPTGNYPKVKLSIPLVGTNGETLLSSKLFYQIWIEKDGQEQPLTLTATLYTYLEADMTEIPYTYDDNWDVYAGGETVYLNQGVDELATWTKIGVQSIYRGAGEEHKSNIGWMENYSGINNLNADLKAGKAVIFNLSGQRLQTPQKGLNIINGKKVVIK